VKDINRLLGHLGLSAASACILFVAVLVMSVHVQPGELFGLPQMIGLAGAIGAIVNNYQRISRLSQQPEAVQAAAENRVVVLQLYITPLIGARFAMLLWATFFSGLVTGALFPNIGGASGTYTGFHDLFKNATPCTNADAMKGVFWGFVAGYAEKYVPNILDRLAVKPGQ
jgi:hypothetical protein